MRKIVHILWIDPRQSVDRYAKVLDGIKIQHRMQRPVAELLFVETQTEAEELKARMDQLIPKKSYTVLDEENKPLDHVVTEPEISILDIP